MEDKNLSKLWDLDSYLIKIQDAYSMLKESKREVEKLKQNQASFNKFGIESWEEKVVSLSRDPSLFFYIFAFNFLSFDCRR